MAIAKAVLITGCSTGIGRATAVQLAAKGWSVYATARRVESVADLAEQGCKLLPLDVCDEASMQAAVHHVEAAEGAIGVLINNAGYGSEGPVEEVPMDEVRRQFETNVFGLLRLTQLALPGMRRQRWGRVVNLSSMGGRMTLPGGGIYHATKYAIEALSDALRFEVRGFGVDVIVVEPGAIKTEFGNTAIARVEALGGSDDYAGFRDALKQNIRNAYEGPMAAFAVGPEAVARVIERAVASRRPRTRYVITAGAKMLIGLRGWLPDRTFDAFLRTQFPSPGR
ncbi:MAG: oxidoreductase [Deltaproteobacteria bacterium]|nr:oxidoreductase [Deltaproteobacteria bacterium]